MLRYPRPLLAGGVRMFTGVYVRECVCARARVCVCVCVRACVCPCVRVCARKGGVGIRKSVPVSGNRNKSKMNIPS